MYFAAVVNIHLHFSHRIILMWKSVLRKKQWLLKQTNWIKSVFTFFRIFLVHSVRCKAVTGCNFTFFPRFDFLFVYFFFSLIFESEPHICGTCNINGAHTDTAHQPIIPLALAWVFAFRHILLCLFLLFVVIFFCSF